MEKFLGEHRFVAGDEVTIADISCIATISTLVNFVHIDEIKYPKMYAWFNVMKSLDFYIAENAEGSELFSKMIKEKIASVKN